MAKLRAEEVGGTPVHPTGHPRSRWTLDGGYPAQYVALAYALDDLERESRATRRPGDGMTRNHPDEHTCFFRGCAELVQGRYHCDRHEAILQARRDVQARRNSELARERREAASRTASGIDLGAPAA
jgi:hypothetical protein